jgi:NADH-quinone oxidoreductase subunit G
LSDVLKHKLPYDSLRALRQTLFATHPHLMRIGQITPGDPADIRKLAALGGNVDKALFKSSVDDFYLTNPIARASPVMAECSSLAQGRAAATAAE